MSMTYRVILQNFCDDDTIIEITDVHNVDFTDEMYLIFTGLNDKVVASFDKSYVKGFYKIS